MKTQITKNAGVTPINKLTSQPLAINQHCLDTQNQTIFPIEAQISFLRNATSVCASDFKGQEQETIQLMKQNGRIATCKLLAKKKKNCKPAKKKSANLHKHANSASKLLPQALRCILGQLFATKVSVLLSSAHQICGVARATQVVTSHHKSQFPASWSEVQRVRLSRKSCMIKVESL